MVTSVSYARRDGVALAFQVLGGGFHDLVVVPGCASHLDHAWDEPGAAAFLERLAARTRLILYDRRGQGLSDRPEEPGSPADHAADLLCVLDAAGSEKAAVLGISQGGPVAITFAAAHPSRITALLLYGTYARAARGDGYAAGHPREVLDRVASTVGDMWGGEDLAALFAPSAQGDPGFRRWWARATRPALSPRGARATLAAGAAVDVRDRLAAVRAPTLVLHRRGDRVNPVEHARQLAASIAGARLAELSGADHLWWLPDAREVAEHVHAFMEAVLGCDPARSPSQPGPGGRRSPAS